MCAAIVIWVTVRRVARMVYTGVNVHCFVWIVCIDCHMCKRHSAVDKHQEREK